MIRSTNNGNSWTSANAGLTVPVTAFAVRPNQSENSSLFAGTQGGGVFFSTNNGRSWITVNSGLEDLYITSLATNSSSISLLKYGKDDSDAKVVTFVLELQQRSWKMQEASSFLQSGDRVRTTL